MIKKRLAQFIDFKGVSKYRFYKETELSNGFLDKHGSICSEKIEKIISHFPELNLYWLVTGNGPMTKSANSGPCSMCPKGVIPVFNGDTGIKNKAGTLSLELFPGCDYAEKVTGGSMAPLIANNSIIVGKSVDKTGIIYGEAYGIHTCHNVNVAKYLFESSTPGCIKMECYDRNKPGQEIKLSEIVFCFIILFVINPV